MSMRWKSTVTAWLAAIAIGAGVSNAVQAQTDPLQEPPVDPATESVKRPVSADFKGSVGGGLIGAELGFVLPAMLGARDAWYYIVFPVVGAAGGVLAGYYGLERGDGRPEAAVAVLVTGMALVIPATVLTLAGSAYEPDTEVPLRSALGTARAAVEAGPGLVRWSRAGVLLAPPGVEVATHAGRPGEAHGRSLRVPLVSGVF